MYVDSWLKSRTQLKLNEPTIRTGVVTLRATSNLIMSAKNKHGLMSCGDTAQDSEYTLGLKRLV